MTNRNSQVASQYLCLWYNFTRRVYLLGLQTENVRMFLLIVYHYSVEICQCGTSGKQMLAIYASLKLGSLRSDGVGKQKLASAIPHGIK